ncbi:CAAX prenyl protease 2-like [Ornithodoros turicata]|uniref:CAAX prenyl protease 2-like n=1 Tax=Ornithodoros turicata TaxID=34597 RepID=UPI003139D9F2
MGLFDSYTTNSCLSATLWSFMLAVTYVGSLYIWRTKDHRDHPSTIKRRFVSVFIIICISPLFVTFGADLHHFKQGTRISSLLGLRSTGWIQAAILPLFLTMVLFAGPLAVHYCDGVWSLYLEPRYWYSNLKNLIWIRNHVVAPFSEEFTFRACMLPILVPCLGERSAVIIGPLFFGVAHFHHLIEKMTRTSNMKFAIMQSLFQFAYTTIFGAYSVYLFLRTGHFIAPFIAHAFCNHMGFPDFGEVFSYKQPTLTFLLLAFAVGLVGWLLLAEPLTSPWLYGNDIYTL